jgi:dihydrofolate reductase
MHAYVATHQKLFDDRVLVTDDPVQVIASEKKKAGKDIWILGGGVLIQTLLNAELIDTFVIALTPNLLGSGKKLFHPLATQIPLDLRKTEVIDGLPILTWERR